MRTISFKMASCVAAIACWIAPGVAWADDRPAAHPGRDAAHAALLDGADVPATPPALPAAASDEARKALANTAFGKKGEAERRAHASARKHASDAAADARIEAANRAAQGSVAAAARAANADARVAAGQARATAAKTAAAGHKSTPPVTGSAP
jgi:hypothetical protein